MGTMNGQQKIAGSEEKQKIKPSILNFLRQEWFAEELRYLRAEMEIPKSFHWQNEIVQEKAEYAKFSATSL